MREKEEHHQALVEQEDQVSSLQKESHKLQNQNQLLQSQVIHLNCSNWPNLCSQTGLKNLVSNPQLSQMQVQSLEVQSLKTRLKELEMALTQAEEQVRS